MASEKTAALVVRTIPFSETSLIVHLFTREHGLVAALAKGAHRPKSSFETALDLLALCRVVFLRKSGETLDLLTEAKLERRFRGSEQGLPALYAGYYVAELLRELTERGDPHPELFDIAADTIDGFGQHPKVGLATFRFEIAALRLLGHFPSLRFCVETGEPVPWNGPVPFSVPAGGVLSPAAQLRKPTSLRLSPEVLRTWEALADADESWPEITLDRKSQRELRNVLTQVFRYLLGRPLRMDDYLGMLWD